MPYYFNKTIEGSSFDEVVDRVNAGLAEEGFGVLTDIDVAATMKKKLDKDMPAYRILGACSPSHAFKALTAENKIGTMLPCSVIVRDAGDGKIEVAAVDPVASMQAVENDTLGGVAQEVQKLLAHVVEQL